jgi:hypothetical protein
MPLEGFEPAIPTSQQPQTHALDRAAIGTGYESLIKLEDTSFEKEP